MTHTVFTQNYISIVESKCFCCTVLTTVYDYVLEAYISARLPSTNRMTRVLIVCLRSKVRRPTNNRTNAKIRNQYKLIWARLHFRIPEGQRTDRRTKLKLSSITEEIKQRCFVDITGRAACHTVDEVFQTPACQSGDACRKCANEYDAFTSFRFSVPSTLACLLIH